MNILETAAKLENEDRRRIETCKKYGFKEGTEKLGECVLRIMEMEIIQLQTHKQIKSTNSSANQQRALLLEQQKLIEQQRVNQSLQMLQRSMGIVEGLQNPGITCNFDNLINQMVCK